MPLLPIASSRVSEPLKNQRLLSQLNADQLAIQRQQDQLSTGKRVVRVSDDPAAAGRAIILQRGIGRVEQLSRNATATESFYTATDAALGRVDAALTEARGATVEAAQNILSSDERNALAATIRGALESAVAAGNSLFRDHQILGGYLETQDPLRIETSGIVFSGNDAVGKTKIGGGDVIPIGVNGSEALGLAETVLLGSPLESSLARSSRLEDLRDGKGVRPGLIRISDGGNFVDVNLREASTIGDIEDILEAVDLNGRSLTLDISADGITLRYTDGAPGTLAVADATGEYLAQDLSISNPLGINPPPLIANGLRPSVTEATPLSKLNGGAGIDVSAGLQIKQGSQVITVDLSDTNTVADVLVAINRSGADVRAEIDEVSGGIKIRALRSGVDYSIGENGGLAATALGIRSATGATRLSELRYGIGPVLNDFGPDFSIIRPDGVQLDVELTGAETIDDVLNLIRNHPQNQDTRRVIPGLNPVGNGIELVAPPGAQPLVIRRVGASNAAEALGFLAKNQAEVSGTTIGPVAVLSGGDYVPKEAGGTIDTLTRLEAAVREGDLSEIARLQTRLDNDFDRSSRIRGRVGVWSQNLDVLKSAADDQAIALKSQLSTEVDADLATVISQLQQRQTSLEASLKLIGQTARLSLLDFL